MNYNNSNLISLMNFVIEIQESIRKGTDNSYFLSCILTDKSGRTIAKFGKRSRECPTSFLPRTISKQFLTRGGVIINMPNYETILSEVDSVYWSDNDINVCDDMIIITGKGFVKRTKHTLEFLRNYSGKVTSKYNDKKLDDFITLKERYLVTYKTTQGNHCILARILSFDDCYVTLETRTFKKENCLRSEIIQIK